MNAAALASVHRPPSPRSLVPVPRAKYFSSHINFHSTAGITGGNIAQFHRIPFTANETSVLKGVSQCLAAGPYAVQACLQFAVAAPR